MRVVFPQPVFPAKNSVDIGLFGSDNPLKNFWVAIANSLMNNSKPSSYIYQYDGNTRYYSYSVKDKIINKLNAEWVI